MSSGEHVEAQGMQRRLTAIMSADVVGYSRLMAVDEEGTLARLKAYREALFDPTVAERHVHAAGVIRRRPGSFALRLMQRRVDRLQSWMETW